MNPGGTFILFTSWSLLNKISIALKGNIDGRPLYKQGSEPPYKILDTFKKAGNGVLLGTDTFWQGVDVRGEALSCVVITRLPFAAPASPFEEAKSEWLASKGLDVFQEHSLPNAVIKFRQGFGRLMRSSTDFGAVVLLDPRVETKRYGRAFLNSITRCASRLAYIWS